MSAAGYKLRSNTGVVKLLVPREKWVNKLLEYNAIKIKMNENGKERFVALHRGKLVNLSDIEILTRYNAEVRGLYNYYSIANDSFKIGKFANLMKYSMYKTFACKYKTNVHEEFLDFDPAEIKAALNDPAKSRVDEMLAAAEKAEREYAAEAAAYVQTPADIVAQAQTVQDQAVENSFSIYQLKGGNETLDYRFEPLDSIHSNGLSVKPENYKLVYEAPLTEKDNLESIYTRFNMDRPADFTGHSLSVSDIVVLHQDGKNTAHYCDRVGFIEVPEFLQERQPELTPDDLETGERIRTPRGSFYVTAMSREQMEAAGYGVHHISDDGKYLIMGNGTRAFAVAAEQPEKDNPLRTAEMTLEDDYGMIDGVINNGRRGEELEKAQEYAERATPEKPSIHSHK